MTAPSLPAVSGSQLPVPPALGVAEFLNSVRVIERNDGRHLHRMEFEVRLPKLFQYEIEGKKKRQPGTEEWETTYSVGITSDGYDYLNQWAGIQIVTPEWVHDEKGERVRNPIHRKDYLYLRLGAVWYNSAGQQLYYQEDIEVDYQLMYQDARLNAVWYDAAQYEEDPETGKRHRVRGSSSQKHTATAVPIIDPNSGQPMLNDDGTPAFRIELPPEQELKALQRLYQLRTFGLRYAQTVGKTRLLKAALGIRKLQVPRATPVAVKVVGYRDEFTPEQRIDAARHAMEIYGTPIQAGAGLGLSSDDLAEVEPDFEEEAGIRVPDEPDDGEADEPVAD